ncbi:unnamed protein product [Protopolystoma xenopodis]|uniref:Uncharacterized protein n=1 Tax=Protopolystoma xenopodis TaxID=117903 RepID=A0A448WY82_9PLAT|nr:unnamed protein product [Protopolystoma xenopodis]
MQIVPEKLVVRRIQLSNFFQRERSLCRLPEKVMRPQFTWAQSDGRPNSPPTASLQPPRVEGYVGCLRRIIQKEDA